MWPARTCPECGTWNPPRWRFPHGPDRTRVVHITGQVVDGQQRCVRCRQVLVAGARAAFWPRGIRIAALPARPDIAGLAHDLDGEHDCATSRHLVRIRPRRKGKRRRLRRLRALRPATRHTGRVARGAAITDRPEQERGQAPYGWRWVHELQPDEDEQRWIEEIIAMRDDGWSLREIATWLTEEQVPTRRAAGGWNPETVRAILARAGRDTRDDHDSRDGRAIKR